jgi:hypothetical protein
VADDPRDPDDAALERRIAEARPDPDALMRAARRARVEQALFGAAAAVTVGRYRLGRALGEGGGGAVFAAEDPELHREVAIKLIRCASPAHRTRALAEGRALARLSHPNVVAVHDVGETADHVYLVMELLPGPTLRELDGVRALIAAYRQAAAGLAAAHAAGLIHRDFKPDNARLGDDRRLRVVDFGLATEAADDAPDPAAGAAAGGPARPTSPAPGGPARPTSPAPVGTPRYMAPEQRAGAPPTPAADQYALGASLREAMRGRAPRWLARVIARATAARPADRYPSLDALARALAQGPRRPPAWLAAAATAVLAALLVARGAGSDVCGGDGLAPVWTPARATGVMQHLASLGTPFAVAVAPLIRDRLAGLGGGWRAAHASSCAAHARGELSDALYDRATVCLARARASLGETLQLLDDATAAQLAPAVSALALTEPGERCADPRVIAAETAPPSPALRVIDHQIDLAAIHARAQTARAVELARTAVSLAEIAHDDARRARAELVLGQAYMTDQRPLAIEPLHRALLFAIASRLDEVATEAYARHAYVRAMVADARAPDGLELARAIAARTGATGSFARALLANNVGAIAMLAGDLPRARGEFHRAVAEAAAVTGPGAVELQTAVSNLALLTPEAGERRKLHDAAVAQVTAAVGPDHPQSLDQQLLRIVDDDDPDAVIAALVPLCRRIAALHPTLARNLDRCAVELAWQATAIGQPARVREVAALVARHRGPPAQIVLAYAELAEGRPSAALLAALDAMARRESAAVGADAGANWIQHWTAANAGLVLAAAARAAGEAPRARAVAADALAHLETYRAITGVTDGKLARRLAWARRLTSGG